MNDNFNHDQLLLSEFRRLIEIIILSSNTSPKVYTIGEGAEILKCKERTIKHHLYEKRDLRYCKIGREVRIKEDDLKEFLNKRLTPCVLDQELLS